MLVASLVRTVANVNTACTHHLVTKVKPALNVSALFTARFEQLLDRPSAPKASGRPRATIKRFDARCTDLPTGQQDLTILHPPYLGVIHYNQIHRLASDLLDFAFEGEARDLGLFDFDSLKTSDISTDNEPRYMDAMLGVLNEAQRITSPKGTIALILGDHRYKGRLRHPESELTIAMERQGWMLHERFIWILNHNGGMHVKRKGHYIDHNYVNIFRLTS